VTGAARVSLPADWSLPPEDRVRSPFTGWTREHHAALADGLLLALRPHFSPARARVLLPGRRSDHGADSDGLEGFARSFLLAAFRLHGEGGRDPDGILPWYRDGVVAGTDPASPERWPRPDELHQAKVEAASIALALQLTRPWLWDTLGIAERANAVGWLATVIGEWYPPHNWVWFQIVVETFLASVGGPHSTADIAAGLELHESLARAGGWYSDGDMRAYDHYAGWALHFYPLVWSRLAGVDFAGPEAERRWEERLRGYLDDVVALTGADGSPLLQGRSLIYRFAAAAPLWVGAATGATNLSPGAVRRAASGIVRHFVLRGAVDDAGLLSLGWHRAWPAMAQAYSGSGSPYWAAKGMLGLALPADHPVWTATEEPLPVERADTRRVLTAPGWLVSGTRADGLVRVVNHGTDHAHPGDGWTDPPLYARLGYSTGTVPPLTGGTVTAPVDSSVVVFDADGNPSHRSGFETLHLGDDGAAAHAVSRFRAHWVDNLDGRPDHGWGDRGEPRWGPYVRVGSLVRGAWEVRVACVETPAEAVDLRIGGWPLAGDERPRTAATDRHAGATTGALWSTVDLVHPGTPARAGVHTETGTSPLGAHVAIPWVGTTVPAGDDGPIVAVLHLGAPPAGTAPEVGVTGRRVTVTWPDAPPSQLDL
jgi:hypothetical protein